MKRIWHHILLFSIMLSLISCGNESCNVVPNVSFRQSFSQGSTDAGIAIGQFKALQGGVAGIIVYNSATDGYIAFDRCSTVNPEQKNPVVIKDAVTIRDPKSGAEWMADGSPSKNATCPLKPYHVSKIGNVYYVQN